jgi:hypothetical protein
MAAHMGIAKKPKHPEDDDAVEPKDRGVELIRRRAKERERAKKVRAHTKHS